MATMISPTSSSPPPLSTSYPASEVSTTSASSQIARQLSSRSPAPFEPDKYRDTYRDAVLEMIERKAAGRGGDTAPPAEETPTAAPDLMSALQASLEEVRARTSGAKATTPAKAATPAKATGPAAKKPAARTRAPAKS